MINKKYLPSKRFVTALSIAVVVILIALILSSVRPNEEKQNSDNLLASNATSSASEIDSDHDGLPDWEEALYDTDPHNIDTDGDGTPDGEEINEGRDPLKANTAANGQDPNDKLSPDIIAQDQAISTADQNLNATEKMAHDLMSNIIASQPVDGSMDQNTVDALVQQSLADIPQKQFAGTTTISDLDLIPVNQVTSTAYGQFATYANSFYIITNPLQKVLGQDITLVKNALSNGTDVDQKSLEKIVEQYQAIINNLIKMPLPAVASSGAVINHLTIINDLEILVAIDNDIINSASNDTVNIYADLQVYNTTLGDLTTALTAVDNVLEIQRK